MDRQRKALGLGRTHRSWLRKQLPITPVSLPNGSPRTLHIVYHTIHTLYLAPTNRVASFEKIIFDNLQEKKSCSSHSFPCFSGRSPRPFGVVARPHRHTGERCLFNRPMDRNVSSPVYKYSYTNNVMAIALMLMLRWMMTDENADDDQKSGWW